MIAMKSEPGLPEERRPWTLLLGPGDRLEETLPLMQALLAASAADAPHLEQAEDLGELLCTFHGSGRLVLDSDQIPIEDVGLVRRLRVLHPELELHAFGEEVESRAARALRQVPDLRWWPARLDVDLLRTWAEVPEASQCSAPAIEPASPPPRPRRSRESAASAPAGFAPTSDPLLAEVEAILGAPEAAQALEAATLLVAPPHPEVPPPAPDEPRPAATEETPGQLESPGPRSPAPYFKHQVADLADIVQRVDLGLDAAVRDAGEELSDEALRRLDELGVEVARLKQFTRTLSFLAAPPPPGQQRFALAPLFEETLAAKRNEPGSPRYLVRSQGQLEVRSDKALLAQALDALLFLAHELAGSEGTVRVDARAEADPTGVANRARVSIRFPAADHEHLTPSQILEPYGLRRLLPELGANALAAAAGILQGQGGSLELDKEAGGGFEFVLRLPLSD